MIQEKKGKLVISADDSNIINPSSIILYSSANQQASQFVSITAQESLGIIQLGSSDPSVVSEGFPLWFVLNGQHALTITPEGRLKLGSTSFIQSNADDGVHHIQSDRPVLASYFTASQSERNTGIAVDASQSQTTTISNETNTQVVDLSASTTSLTINFPSADDGRSFELIITQAVLSIDMVPAVSSDSIVGALTTTVGYITAKYRYSATAGKWYRVV